MVDDFEASYLLWRSLPFPAGSSNDELDELHADLALYDTWVADTAVPYALRGVYDPARVDVIGALHQFQQDVRQRDARGTEAEKQLLSEYHLYAETLIRVYEGFLRRGDANLS